MRNQKIHGLVTAKGTEVVGRGGGEKKKRSGVAGGMGH